MRSARYRRVEMKILVGEYMTGEDGGNGSRRLASAR